MKSLVLQFSVAACLVLTVSASEESRISMEKHHVVPDVIDEAPQELLEVSYPSGAKAELGKELTPTSVKDVPTLKWNADEDAFYTVALVDPDAPSREDPKYREFKHWLVVNVPGGNVSKGESLSAYAGSGPPKGTGLHRYVFLVYKQEGKLAFDEKRVPNTSREDRPSFSIRDFAEKYNLGQPIAGNFYQAQWDEYVPVLHKQLSG